MWEDVRHKGLKTINMIEDTATWEFQVSPREHTIRKTFHHTLKAIFEDAGNWFLNDSSSYHQLEDASADLNRAINRMIRAMETLRGKDLNEEFTFQWGSKTTIGGAIHQSLFHSVEHFGQIRNWIGISQRNQLVSEKNSKKL
jgi:hypothetical protein